MPRAIRPEQIMRYIATIAIGHCRQHIPAVVGAAQLDLGDPWKTLTQRIGVELGVRSHAVKIELLEESHVRGRPLALARITRVVEARSIRVPGQAPTGRSAVDARHGRAP